MTATARTMCWVMTTMISPSHNRLERVTHARLTRLVWLWVLGEVWFTLLWAGAVGVLLWTR
jgi:hypothetical protein